MDIINLKVVGVLAVLEGILLLPPGVGKVQAANATLPPSNSASSQAPDVTRRVNCDAGQTIQEAVDNSNNGDTVLVTGTCDENVSVGDGRTRVTLDGQGMATINGGSTAATITVRGRNTNIVNFTISGGRDGILVQRGGTATITGNTITGAVRDAIVLNRDAEATIDGNAIQNAGRFGINLDQNGTGRIVNNTIQNNSSHGILVDESSSARIGFLTFFDTTAGPNTISNNGGRGVLVIRSATAIILANTISSNTQGGVGVFRVSHADVGANTINSNGDSGIFVSENSGVNLGQTSIVFDSSNSTSTNNATFGITCTINSYAEGSRGTLNGASGATSFSGNCANNTTP